jgi:restriction system protein
MGNINTDAGSLRDLITEEIGCKAGLLLTSNEAGTLLKRSDHSKLWLFDEPEDAGVRIRPEEIEDIIVTLRHQIGNLPDAKPAVMARLLFFKRLHEQGIDATPLVDAFEAIIESKRHQVLGEEAVNEMVEISGMHPLLVVEFLLTIADSQDRSVSWFHARQSNVTWAIPLQDLFQSESIPPDPDAYLDQRYIDFLVHNSEDLALMHWRNFERLTSEFFRRKGYEIELGPGGNDGGVDVRVWPAESDKGGPPLLLIQCKRHAETNDVEIQTVKAFWTDVSYEDAHRGMIATTSRIAPGGIKVSRARRWPLGFVENKQVHHWVRTMWRHSPMRP